MNKPNFARAYQMHAIAASLVAASIMASAPVVAQLVIPENPLATNQITKPLTMLVVGRDHTLYYEAYNDASDIDGDGTLDIRFKPDILYYGLFDSTLCYSHNNKSDDTGLFTPAAPAGDKGVCTDNTKPWSGNWLNYVTTSRIDALRKVFYGGYREVDTAARTVLRRAYIPQDAHSWAKEYTSVAVDGYNIADYTPLNLPTAADKRHFFGNLTANMDTDCATLATCSDLPPLLRIVTNSKNRVWQWASTERPVLHPNNNLNSGTRTDYTVRVEVCTAAFHAGCKDYPKPSRKPIGLLHEYGENESMLFGLLSGSYNKNMSGGVLRKVVSSFKAEVDANTGQFTEDATLVKLLDALRIRDFNNNRTDRAYRKGWVTTRAMKEAEFVDWGNPIGEMMYESLRYFAGKKAATADFATKDSYDKEVGLPVATWDDPYGAGGAAKAPWCARANMLVVSGINPSFDSDKVPGCDANFGAGLADGLGNFKAADLAKTITDGETKGASAVAGQRFIGQSGAVYDGAPTAKAVTSLGSIRGLAPDEPTKQGSYYSASAAYHGQITDLRNDLTGSQTVDTYAVVLSSPLPRIEAPLTDGKIITLVPFAKSVSGNSIVNTKGDFQPTNQIVDFYVDTIANSKGDKGADYDENRNGGRYYAKFRINFEDVEQGADHDMDAIVVYEIAAEANGTLRVRLTPEYEAGGIQHSMGYVISGSTKDGVYLVVQDENVDAPYYLNVPPGKDPGFCDEAALPNSCKKLPYINGPFGPPNLQYSERTFSPGASAATLLKDPLWYAAKWGGFNDSGNSKDSKTPDLDGEWDADKDGVPDTYFLVQNPLRLKAQLKQSFDTILERSASSGSITSNGQQITNDTQIFHTSFNSAQWHGEVSAYPISAEGVNGTASWKASENLPASALRTMYTRNDVTGAGIEFKALADFSAAQRLALGTQAVVDFLRGDRSQELEKGGLLRNRTKVLGDVVHSAPYYVKDTDTVYVGANDGFLHAFNAKTGVELFAYAPSHIIDKLRRLSDRAYVHTFFVDGDIAVSTRDQTPGENWLVGALGRGAKGLFGLNVSAPDGFRAAAVAWELKAAGDFVDIGYVLGRPQIAKMNNGALVAIVGNGYNSTSGRAILYIIDLKTGALIKKIDTEVGGDNGLATPGLVDVDGDKDIDVIYAGDRQGNLWKFDVRSADPLEWAIALEGTPLFVAKDPNDELKRQPILAQVSAGYNNVFGAPGFGKRFVFFGTGSYMLSTDPAEKQVQSWYGIIDDDLTAVGSRAELKGRSIETTATVAGLPVRAFSTAEVGDMVGKRGWYVDLKDPNARGERIVTSSVLVYGINPALLVSSIIPDADPCTPGGTGYVNAIDPFSGTRLTAVFFDVNRDKKFDAGDSLPEDKVAGSVNLGIGMTAEPVIVGDLLVVGGSSGAIASMKINLGFKFRGRASWREILN